MPATSTKQFADLHFSISISLPIVNPVRMSSASVKVSNKESFSPPTYSVESDGYGNLYSRKYGISWPNRPGKGTHSVEAEMQMRIATSKQKKAEALENNDEAKLIRECKLVACADEEAEIFDIRAMTTKYATRKFEQYQLRNVIIYYQLPSEHRIDKLSTTIPLMIACKNSKDQITHYQIKCYTCRDESGKEDLWCAVRFGEYNRVKQVRCMGFVTIEALLEYWCSLNADCRIKVSKV